MATATYPASIWDGDSANRDSDDGVQAAPDHRDWERMIAEIAAVQESNRGIDPDTTINNHGTLESVTGLSVEEYGNAALHKTVITLDAVELDTTDGSTPATDAAWATQKLYTFPEGHVVVVGAHQVYPLGKIEAVTGGGGGLSDTADLEIGVGTTARANASNFQLQTAEDNIVPGQAGVDLTSKTSDAIESSQLAAALFFDGSASAAAANLNVVTLDNADHGTSADKLKVSGTITILWTMQGND